MFFLLRIGNLFSYHCFEIFAVPQCGSVFFHQGGHWWTLTVFSSREYYMLFFFDLFPFKFVLFLWLPLFRFCTCWIGTLSYPFLHLLFCVFWEMAWTLFLTSVQFIISAIIFLFPKSALFSVVLNSSLLLFHVCNSFSLKTMNF